MNITARYRRLEITAETKPCHYFLLYSGAFINKFPSVARIEATLLFRQHHQDFIDIRTIYIALSSSHIYS
ncbi:uncharacterized protein LAJ45_08482 [Morchella importuna]|uniref:uncharacterized protein n=1 Tax=Morchella importuna TaxID=1174673 RepID=UPI001E8D63EF|nr:uncharacterized protein LAJ45_08482 [Morchella importuna]KAH8147326.1 hypothetical protein LAJ45_08482 [Morchella importuna]